MNCKEASYLLDGFSDGELDLVNHVKVEAHLDACLACRSAHQRNVSLKDAMADEGFYHRAPGGVRERVLSSLDVKDTDTTRSRWWQSAPWLSWATATAAVVMLATLLFLYWPARSNNNLLAQELVSSHIRSLMADHITDVPSSDQHTVKPWFDGRLDFAPPVIDLEAQGFVLVGARMDYASNRPVAALVYKRRQHIINLFIYPDPDAASDSLSATVKQGYNLLHWDRGGMTFWAVSDLNVDELKEFAHLLQAASAG